MLLASTRIVGMVCPGLHSLYNGLTLDFSPGDFAPELRFKVASADHRFSSLDLDVQAGATKGRLRTFLRPRPQRQASLAHAATLVGAKEFRGWKARVVGGSRGLGEVATKLIAAGGGEVCLTYHRGAADADAVCAELRSADNVAYVVPLDVTGNSPLKLPWAPTHLLYFASPHITLDKSAEFSESRFTAFCRYYVTGYYHVFSQLALPIASLYPSTIFLEQPAPHMAEYCAAKAAGEELCRHLARSFPACQIHAPRLPRVLTDQTAGLISGNLAPAMPLILSELRVLGSSKNGLFADFSGSQSELRLEPKSDLW